MKTESLEYRDGDVTLRGFLGFDDSKSGRRPGVLVMPEAFGLGAQVAGLAEEMTKAKADWQVVSYAGTVHSFTNPDADKVGNPGIAYNKSADERSWKAMTALFEEIFAQA